MNKDFKYYSLKYLKSNGVVLLCELLVVFLLGLVCTLLLGGQPLWLAPVLSVVAYILAELRFMMAYVATVASKAEKESRETLEEDALPAEEDQCRRIWGEQAPWAHPGTDWTGCT